MTGDEAGGPNDAPGTDIVMMDDFLYGEPQALGTTSAAQRSRFSR